MSQVGGPFGARSRVELAEMLTAALVRPERVWDPVPTSVLYEAESEMAGHHEQMITQAKALASHGAKGVGSGHDHDR